MHYFLNILLLLPLIFSFGCAGVYKHTIEFDRTYPLRVAILPFYQIDKNGSYSSGDGSILLDGVPFISEVNTESPAEFLRSLTQKEISETALDPLSPTLVDLNLSHSGLTKQASLELDLKRVIDTPAQEMCSKILSCDAVLYGQVISWDRAYYGIESVSSVGLELRLVSAKTGKVLFSSSGTDSDGRGLSKGPTGFSDLVVAPISGLDSKVIANLARNLVVKMLAPLKMPDQKELDETTPPAIFAATHDVFQPTMTRKQVLTVLTFGTPQGSASFSIGSAIKDIPMIERSPGHYVGEYYPSPVDVFSSSPVVVNLADKLGRKAQQIIGKGAITLQ
jgi:hypothetical protein